MDKEIKDGFSKTIDGIINEAAKEITGMYTIVVKDGNASRRFTFESHKINSLKKELSKRYGDRIVNKIASYIKKAETKGTLKNFAKDDSVDFEVTDSGEKVKAVFREKETITEGVLPEKESYPGEKDDYIKAMIEAEKKNFKYAFSKKEWDDNIKAIEEYKERKKKEKEVDEGALDEVKVMRKCSKSGKKYLVKSFDNKSSAKDFIKKENMNGKKYFLEAKVEIDDKNGRKITVDGKPFNGSLGDLKNSSPSIKAAFNLIEKSKNASLSKIVGNSNGVDIETKADGSVIVRFDDKVYNSGDPKGGIKLK